MKIIIFMVPQYLSFRNRSHYLPMYVYQYKEKVQIKKKAINKTRMFFLCMEFIKDVLNSKRYIEANDATFYNCLERDTFGSTAIYIIQNELC